MRKWLLLLSFVCCCSLVAQTSDFKHINFEKADNIAKQLKGASLENLPVLVYRLTSNLETDVEKFRALYFWVCSNIANDYRNHVYNLSKRRKFKNDSIALHNWNDAFKTKTLKNLIKHKRTICTGYAYLVQELALLAGLNCKMVHGYGRTVESNVGELSIPNHSWNAIKLNDKWYLSDPTWASGFFHFDEGRFVAEYNDGYFLTDPELFVKSHYPLDTQWILTKSHITIDDFLTGALVYGSTFKHGITPIAPLKMKFEVMQNESRTFKFQIPENLNPRDISIAINGGVNQRNFNVSRIEGEPTVLEIERIFKRRGLFDVHFKVGEDVVTTYTVKVVKNRSK